MINQQKLIMKKIKLLAVLALLLLASVVTSHGQTTAFTYQGRVIVGGNPTNGSYDFQFRVFDTAPINTGTSYGSPNPNNVNGVAVSNGLFTVTLDFGTGVFTGPARWLQMSVRTNGGGAYTSLSPRQPLTPTPYAIYAGNAAQLGGQIPAAYVAKAGDTMTGTLNLPANGLTLAGNQLVASGGNIGIGTASPLYPLVVRGGNRPIAWERYVSGVQSGKTWAWEVDGAGTYLRNATDTTLPLTILNGGNIGIGTINPEAILSLYSPGTDLIFKLEDRRTATTGDFLSKQAFYDYGGEAAYIGLRHNLYLGPGPRAITFGLSGSEKMRISNDGNVGIGTTSPGYKLEVAGVNLNNGLAITGPSSPGLTLKSSSGKDWEIFAAGTGVAMGAGGLAFYNNTDNSYRMIIDTSGNVGIGTYNPQTKLDVAGETRTCVLTITGGCDLAEPFEMSGNAIPKGAVVAIDEERPGRLKMSTQAYDTRVAGIVSGANGIKPGISLHQDGVLEGGENVALSGRVYALADASSGPIKPGDLLTTSQTPGHCMKVTNLGKAQGAIIGKAMSALPNGKGMVLVLVSLQ